MPNKPPSVQVEFAPEFKQNLRALAKKYRHIRSDVQPVIEQIVQGAWVTEMESVPRLWQDEHGPVL